MVTLKVDIWAKKSTRTEKKKAKKKKKKKKKKEKKKKRGIKAQTITNKYQSEPGAPLRCTDAPLISFPHEFPPHLTPAGVVTVLKKLNGE